MGKWRNKKMNTIYKIESSNGITIEILTNFSKEELNEKQKSIFSKYGSKIYDELQDTVIENDPETIERKKQWVINIDKAFKDAGFDIIYKKEIPNSYNSSSYYPNSFLVTTKFGIINVEHRKHVYELDYSGLDTKISSKILFEGENTTKYGYIIHAWGIDKLTEYLITLKCQQIKSD